MRLTALLSAVEGGKLRGMGKRHHSVWFVLAGTVALHILTGSRGADAEAPAAAVQAFDRYVAKVEARLGDQHRATTHFIAGLSTDLKSSAHLRNGELVIEHLTPAGEPGPPGALLHHWRGTAFVAGSTAADFERLMKNFDAYPQHFAPQVVRARILTPYSLAIPDQFSASMRVRQKHVITVVMDTTYDVRFGRLDPRHGWSNSRSTKVDEISSPGTSREKILSPSEEHGFLWRMNTYWSYEERDGGLYVQVESISLTRAIPTGLGWAVRPYVESVPRESLEFTLRATMRALTDNRQQERR